MGGGRRPPRCRGDGPALPYPVGRRLQLCVRAGMQHLFVVVRRHVRPWCLESAALLLAAARGGRARCVRLAVRRACACCCHVAAVDAAVRVRCGSRDVRRAGGAQCDRGGWCNEGGASARFCCRHGAAPCRERRACGPPVPVREMLLMLPQAVVAVAAAEPPLRLVRVHGVVGAPRGAAARGAAVVLKC